MADIEFIEGLRAKAPNDRAPEYVKARLSIKREDLIGWLQQRDEEWINADVKVGRSGNWYVAVDTWKPNSGQSDRPAQRQEPKSAPSGQRGDANNGFTDDEIPF